MEYMKQLPNKKLSSLEEDEALEEFYDYDDISNSRATSKRRNSMTRHQSS